MDADCSGSHDGHAWPSLLLRTSFLATYGAKTWATSLFWAEGFVLASAVK
jgi:hypothetical protein